jgi:hypothetical protein
MWYNLRPMIRGVRRARLGAAKGVVARFPAVSHETTLFSSRRISHLRRGCNPVVEQDAFYALISVLR